MTRLESPTGISVVLCCFNSRELLKLTLTHLAHQKVPTDLRWEVVLVDNASTDDTTEFAEKTWQQLGNPTEFHLVGEPDPGLSNARKRGVLESKYEYVIFCDDDNWLCPDYVTHAYNILQGDQTLGGCGGCGKAVSNVTIPPWFDRFCQAYAVGPQATKNGLVPNLYGAGLTIRADVLRRAYDLGFQSQLSDRRGKMLSSGGDGEINQWIQMFGYRLYYDQRLRFKHFITERRLTWDYFLRLNRGFGHMIPTMHAYYLTSDNGTTQHPTPLSLWKSAWIYRTVRAFVRLTAKTLLASDQQQRQASVQKYGSEVRWLLKNRARYTMARRAIQGYRQVAAKANSFTEGMRP